MNKPSIFSINPDDQPDIQRPWPDFEEDDEEE